MSESLVRVLAYALIPGLAILAGGAVAVVRAPGTRVISAFQHFAAGMVFAAVAVELLPQLHTLDSPIAMISGFIVGVAAMLGGKALFESAGIVVPMVVDVFIDGLLVAIGFAAGVMGGWILLIGLTLAQLEQWRRNGLGTAGCKVLVFRCWALRRAIV